LRLCHHRNCAFVYERDKSPLIDRFSVVFFGEKCRNKKKFTFFSFLGLTLGESQHINPKLAAIQRASSSDIEEINSSFMKMSS